MTALIHVDGLRGRISIGDVLEAYGVSLNRRGRIPCPLHNGQNPTSFAFTDSRFRCFRCGAAGDVFDLIMGLRSCSFRAAVATAAQIVGVPVENLPRIDSAEAQRRVTVARRRVGLRRWRSVRCIEYLDALRELTRAAQQTGRALADAIMRSDAAAEDRAWERLDAIYTERDHAELGAAELETDDESAWLSLYAAEQEGDEGVTRD